MTRRWLCVNAPANADKDYAARRDGKDVVFHAADILTSLSSKGGHSSRTISPAFSILKTVVLIRRLPMKLKTPTRPLSRALKLKGLAWKSSKLHARIVKNVMPAINY